MYVPFRADAPRLRRRLPILTVLVLGALLSLVFASSAFAVTFNPALIISDNNFRAYDSMSQADIQGFLQTQPGVLASYTATDYPSGKRIAASKIIANASVHFHINPKVILTMLQKEQSLLTRSKASLVTGKHPTLEWAMGMGCPDTTNSCIKSGCHTTTPPDGRYPEYRGFGKQIWAAAWSLDAYGEKGKTRPGWHHTKTPPVESAWGVGTTATIGSVKLAIKNLATHKLYTYNPSIGAKSPYGDLSKQAGNLSGNANFWWIYRKYFGDTFADPALRPVYRFVNRSTGNYFYTASPALRYKMLLSKAWMYERVAFSWDTSVAANSLSVREFLNRKTHQYLFSANSAMYAKLTSAANAKTWSYHGVVFKASRGGTSSQPVWAFKNKGSGMYFYTASAKEKATFLSTASRKHWLYRGIAFYIGHR